MLILHDFECPKCGLIFEWAISSNEETAKCPICWDENCKKVFVTPRQFKLKYNPQKDMVDWDGNTSQYWKEYKKMKAEGKKPRIPSLDGDTPSLKNKIVER